jgi:DNA mismatch endonuclease (patch repair protein)
LGVRTDVTFPRQGLALFLDVCFRHRCPEHENAPTASSGYWSTKLDHNVERYRKVVAAFDAMGRTVLGIWEQVRVSAAIDQAPTTLAEYKAAAGAR